MKVRRGFVSNSSSSNFIIIGAKFLENSEEIKSLSEEVWEHLTDCMEEEIGSTYIESERCYIIGKTITTGDYLDNGSIDISETSIKDIYDSILSYIQNVKPEDIKIYYGTRGCWWK